ncbi:MAG TPA: multidrug ABC transporter ATP-binding protein, partial [Microbacterium sp.]|nr:multidrug ABC transporter ATP-binding protein [Microbacterium sp.]
MSMVRGGFGGGLTRGADERTQRERNAEAPHIPHLGRRIVALFSPYRGRLAVTAVLVVLSAALGVVPALLVEQVFDLALFPASGSPDIPLLIELVALMIGLFVASAGLNVLQTWLTSSVGNRVTGDLRVRLFRHLQSMELAFFTRTKTGVIQSRLQNDVGGVASVLTNTFTSILGNSVTVVASLVAMVIIDWRLTLVAIVMLPVLVVIQRRVGQVRARIAAQAQESLSTLTAMTQESLSVSGIMLTSSFNRSDYETGRYAEETSRQVSLQIRQAMSGQGFFAVVGVIMS